MCNCALRWFGMENGWTDHTDKDYVENQYLFWTVYLQTQCQEQLIFDQSSSSQRGARLQLMLDYLHNLLVLSSGELAVSDSDLTQCGYDTRLCCSV